LTDCDSGLPVLDRELAHPAKLAFILGDEREAQGTRVSSYQQVIGADGCPSALQVVSDARVVFICGLLQGEHREGFEHPLDGGSESFGAAKRSSKPKYARYYDARADSIVPDLGEAAGADAGRLLHESRDNGGVEQMRERHRLQPRFVETGQIGIDVRGLFIDGTQLSKHGHQSRRSDNWLQNQSSPVS
jgi:hypothetical protein